MSVPPTAPTTHAQWQRTVEAKLNADELAFLRRCVAKLGRHEIDQLARLSIEDAVIVLRREMGVRR